MDALFSSKTPSAADSHAALAAAIRDKDANRLAKLLQSGGSKPAGLNHVPEGGMPLLLLVAMHDLDACA